MNKRIYIASKTRHAGRWKELRASGVNVISTWIDEAGPDESKDLTDLAIRCLDEASDYADVVIIYAEPGDDLKGALIEVGAALSMNIPVLAVGPCIKPSSAFTHHPCWIQCESLEQALEKAASRDSAPAR